MAKIALWTLEDKADELGWFAKVVGGGVLTYITL